MSNEAEVHFGEWVLFSEGIASNIPDETVLGRIKAKTMTDLDKARSKAITTAKKRGANPSNLRVTALLTKSDSRAMGRKPYKVSFQPYDKPMVFVHDLEYWRERIKPSASRFSK